MGGTTRGRVTLVGAGPGDPDLLTLKAVRALARADVVLHDDLVGDGVLAYANPAARVVAVGKRGGCPSTPQAFIEQLMIREARAGHRVVRLKGGDPCVFGRGGEEMATLRAAGVEVDVVNGITSGLAAATAIGVPLTHRQLAHGVAFVTGHDADDEGEGPDWRALAQSGVTLVVYMGVARAARIRARLLDAGMDRATPVAIVANATRCEQRSVRTTLDRLAEVIDAEGVESPAIIVVGAVAALATSEAAECPVPAVTAAADRRSR